MAAQRLRGSQEIRVMHIYDDSLFDAVVLNLGPVILAYALALLVFILTYAGI